MTNNIHETANEVATDDKVENTVKISTSSKEHECSREGCGFSTSKLSKLQSHYR